MAGALPIPSQDDAARIAAMGEPVVRNLQITQSYHELSAAVAARTGGRANWCTFATWASKQAGQSIRKEDLARALERALTTSPGLMRAVEDVSAAARPGANARSLDTIARRVWAALNPVASVARVSDAVAQGNRKVFAEIGLEFARFAATRLNDAEFDADRIQHFAAGLRDGEPPHGQILLSRAFGRMYRAMFAADTKTQAELMLHASLEIGLHEQTRLQPEIVAAMQATSPPQEDLTLGVLGALFPSRPRAAQREFHGRLIANRLTPLDLAVKRLLRVARKHMRLFLTDQLMTLWVPEDTLLRLGDDLRAEFPPLLKRVASAELRAFMRRFDPSPDDLAGSGAGDWGELRDRMNFIANFFRCFQETAALLSAPFSDTQTVALKAGRRPDGRL